jgi:uncharacterized membrane protein
MNTVPEDGAEARARLARSLLVMPLARLLLGAEGAGLTPRLAEYGIDDQFVADLSAQLELGGSALFIVARPEVRDRLLAELAPYGGTVLRSSVSLADAVARMIDDASLRAPRTRKARHGPRRRASQPDARVVAD